MTSLYFITLVSLCLLLGKYPSINALKVTNVNSKSLYYQIGDLSSLYNLPNID